MSSNQKSRSHIAWVISTYFAQGFPFTVVRILSSIFFTDIGVKERFLGYLNFLNIPWNLKFLWAPFVDAFGTKRSWQIAMQTLLSLALVVISGLCVSSSLGIAQPETCLKLVALAFVIMAFLAATNDIAIDAYYLEGLKERSEQALYSGYRVMAYRIAMVFVRSGLVALVAYFVWLAAESSANPNSAFSVFLMQRLGLRVGDSYMPWALTFGAGAVVFFLLAISHAFLLPRFEAKREKNISLSETTSFFKEAFVCYLKQEKIARILLFIILYKIGDEILFSMVTPFLMRELAVTKAQYSWIGGWVGAIGSIIGAMFGGWWIKQVGLKRAMWPLTLSMNLAIIFYILLAWYRPQGTSFEGVCFISAIHFVEQAAAGLGSAALLIFLLGTCAAKFKAAHYAIGSAIMSIPATLLGGFAGKFVEAYGYLPLFWIAFVSTIPAMALIPFVPLGDSQEKKA